MLFHVRAASGTHDPHPSPPPSPKSNHLPLGVSSVANMFLKIRNVQDRSKSHHLESSSGPPQTHPMVTEHASGKSGPFELNETFVCTDAVNMHVLLGATRDRLLRYAKSLGANCLVDEQACTVYSTVLDPQRLVAVDMIKNIPGCMTILRRNDT
ncbi:hypothetical protein H0H81_000820 [Sphagnurus paluster]|uniref:Uncharacterized protein n=1 Tax=Sphagnurus paluster TaxID=117069 RepID=A0A9P7K6V6_9AGAR|nr:hypothetical protein H0H81_000820 [Sphagnurus paluster]